VIVGFRMKAIRLVWIQARTDNDSWFASVGVQPELAANFGESRQDPEGDKATALDCLHRSKVASDSD
jgi:hypothetical protein